MVIAFVGSVFSPYYARALRRGAADPEDHVAVNVALYGAGGHHWAMTERGRGELARDMDSYSLGPSALIWERGGLTIRIDERTTPLFSRIAGEIRLEPEGVLDRGYALDAEGRHVWRPLAPKARVEVRMRAPNQNWGGHGYFDMNAGERPIARDFLSWDWARGETRDGALIHYDVRRRDGSALNLALNLRGNEALAAETLSPLAALRPTTWRVARAARCDAGALPQVEATLEDTPFYARSLIKSRIAGEPVRLMHESLSLDRLSARWVETLLPFRMPRFAGRR